MFPDPDSFYHAKIALFLKNGVILHAFPWFRFTTWPAEYVDAHFLYHVLLIPFVAAFDPMVGMKVAALVFGLIACAAVYGFLKWLRAPWPTALTLAAMLSPAFLNRIAFPRAISLSVALFTAITWAVLAKRPRVALILSALFVWLYHGWPTALLVLLAAGVAEIVAWRMTKSRQTMGAEGQVPYRAEREAGARPDRVSTVGWPAAWGSIFRVGIAVMAGLALGIVTNPYFPELLSFSVVDIFKIGVVNQGYKISVGSEWRPATWFDLAATCGPAFFALLLSIGAFLHHAIAQRRVPSREEIFRVMACLFLAAGFTALTLKSGRYVEYAVPCLVFAAGALLSASRETVENEWVPAVRQWLGLRRARRVLAAIAVSVVLVSLVAAQIEFVWNRKNYRAEQYAFATEWISANVPADETVFTNTWDVSSILFYLDDTHRYLVGLDPTFMYDPNPELYARWLDIVSGRNADETHIPYYFQSRTVLIDGRDPRADTFAAALQASGLFHEVAKQDTVRLYSCLPDCQF